MNLALMTTSRGWEWLDSPVTSSRGPESELARLLFSVNEDGKSFEIAIDVSQFQPKEITVKTTDEHIVVHGEHEERSDQHGFISREFRRRLNIPKGVSPTSVTSTISPAGILTVFAPKISALRDDKNVKSLCTGNSSDSAHRIRIERAIPIVKVFPW